MANVGSAYVTLMPSMKGFAGALSGEFGASGGKAGKSFGDGLSSGIEGGAARSEGILSKLGGAVATVGKVAAVGFTALTGAVAAIGGAALSAYADYEQLVGGVDTLFGDASGKLQGYAAEAYKTAGMSANQYMTQATSFAASLVQSTGGDTAQAAEYANLAMTSMSDNVNKMGSSMQSVQDAYQGFAKQNYTMLDNLKLGYGGTKTEMERLISDANKLPGVLKQGSDLSIESYSDVVEAIARVQNKMGIAGTTANEAASTISGSIGMAKASWENFLTSLGRDDVDFTQVTTELLDSIGAVATNVAPRVAIIGKGIIQAMPAALAGLGTVLEPVFSEAVATAWNIAANALFGIGIKLPTIDASQITDSFRSAVDAAKLLLSDPADFTKRGLQMVNDVVAGIVAGLPSLIEQGSQIVNGIISSIAASVPMLLSQGQQMAGTIAGGLRESVPQLMEAGLQMLTTLSQSFMAALPQLAQMGGQIILGLVQGLMAGLPSLIEQGPKIVSNIANGISAAAETLLGVGLQVLAAIAQGLVAAVPTLIANIPAILQAVWDAFTAYNWLSLGGTLVTSIGSGIATLGSQIPTKLKGFFDQAVNHGGQFVSEMASKGLSAGSEFLLNIAANVSQMPGRFAGWLSEMILNAASFVAGLGSKASQAGQGFLNGIQGGFNEAVSFVASIPSRLLGAIGNLGSLLVNSGKSLINGLVSGIKDAIGGAVSAVSGALGSIRSLFPFSPAKEGPFSGHGYTTWSGKALVSDFASSISSSGGLAVSAAESVLGDVKSAMSGPVAARFDTASSVMAAASGTARSVQAPGAERDYSGALSDVLILLSEILGAIPEGTDRRTAARFIRKSVSYGV